jgi:hypothetical protein
LQKLQLHGWSSTTHTHALQPQLAAQKDLAAAAHHKDTQLICLWLLLATFQCQLLVLALLKEQHHCSNSSSSSR